MPRVFNNLLYTHTMPNNHYCSTYMTGIPPLDGQTLPDQSAENREDFWPDLRHETCPQVAVKVCWKDLQSCWECSSLLLYTHTMPNNHYCSTYMMAYPHLMAKHYLISQAENRDLRRHETCPQVAVKAMLEGLTIMPRVFINWWRDLQSCWECSSTCYTPIQCQTTTIAAPTWWHTPTWWPNITWSVSRKSAIFDLIW